jgi:hypothetical protein
MKSRLEHALLRPLAAAPRYDTGAPMPLRGSFVELIAGIQLSHQSIVFRRATLFALRFGIAGHVFLLYLHLTLPLFGARLPDIRLSRIKLHPTPNRYVPIPFEKSKAVPLTMHCKTG